MTLNSFTWTAGRVSMSFSYGDHDPVVMTKFSADDIVVSFEHCVPIAEIMAVDTGHSLACEKLTHTAIGQSLRYRGHHEIIEDDRRTLIIDCRDDMHGVAVQTQYTVRGQVPVVSTALTVSNIKPDKTLQLDSVTSWCGAFGSPKGVAPSLRAWNLFEGTFDWLAEGRWSSQPVVDLLPMIGQELTGVDPRQGHSVISSGTWSTGAHAPLAVLESQEFGLAWLFQIEHNGAWRWEIEDNTGDGGIALSGPTGENHSWSKSLAYNESFTSVPASFTLAATRDDAIRNVTAYRRCARVFHAGNKKPATVFNDYMNTINGDPTTEKELPLIKAASDVGIDIFVVDCGWYDDTGDWWPSVGEWLPSTTRFPNGLQEVIQAIHDEGMTPGIWIEPEVIGVKSPIAQRLPDSAFFQRHGQRVVEQERYILDLRDDSARVHLDSVIDRLITSYGIGYFKFDYNVSPGAGTDVDADSPGDGLLGHNRAYAQWIDSIHERYPQVILENCSSGGMREDFAQSSRFQVQSTSDQQDYRLYPVIAASAAMMVLPEQSANWAYPQADMDAETTAFNINTTLLGRFFLSGYINRMDDDQRCIIRNGVNAYNRYVKPMIGAAVPLWPLGLPRWDDSVVSYGLATPDTVLITIWNRQSQGGLVALSLGRWQGRRVRVMQIFPSDGFPRWETQWDRNKGMLMVETPAGGYTSRTFGVTVMTE